MNRIQCVLLVLTGLGCSLHAMADVAGIDQQYASYVILGQSPTGKNIVFARTVIDPMLTCPSISAPGKRMASITMSTRDNPNHFAVIVCEAVIGFDIQYQLDFADKSIPLPMAKSDPTHIQVFGDTGCKSEDCNLGKHAKPFKSLADSGAKDEPDLVLHMGDYNYRGTGGQISFTTTGGQVAEWPYDAGDDLTQADHCGQQSTDAYDSQSAVNSNNPDLWQYWHDDLFESGKKLMASAPWIATRGNHELCSRAGPGYFYFLDPHSNLVKGQQQLSCPTPDANKSPMTNSLQIPNYVVDFKDLAIAVVDSANACDSYTDSPFTKLYTKVFADLGTQVSNKNTWLMTHRPIWGVQSFDSDKSTTCQTSSTNGTQYGCINQMMQQAIRNQATQALPPSIELVLTGHMHKFESVSFGDKRPANIVVGSSGVALSGSTPDGAANVEVDGLPAQVLTTNTQVSKKGKTYSAFGYLDIKLDRQGGWQAELVNPAKKLTLAKCAGKQDLAQGVCELAEGIKVLATQ